MYANVVILSYKSPQDAETGITKLTKVLEALPGLSGFQGFTLVRTSPTQTVSFGRFVSEADARAARERMVPKVRQEVGPYLAAEPDVRPGEVLIAK